MSTKSNSDDDNVSSNASSDQNDSESEQEEIIKNKKRSRIESDSNDSDKSDDSSDNEIKKKEKIKKIRSKNILNSSSDEKSGSDNSDSEKSTKSKKDKSDNEKSDNEKSDNEKSDNEKSKKDKSDNEKSDDEKSDDEIFSPKKKVKKIMDSDSDHQSDENETKKNSERKEEINDIFGEISDEDDDDDEDNKRKKIKTENLQDDDGDDDDDDELVKREQNVDQDEDDEEINRDIFQQFEEEQQPETETRIDVTIPKITTDLGKESHFVKLPNFLSVDTHPYDPSWYEDEIDDDEVLDEEGRARMKLKVENTIRWRNVVDKDGNQQKESNARVVKWSDGSMSLHLGSEIFDIHKQQILGGDNNHLYIRQGTGLLGQSVFRTKLTFRPHSTDSFTHKKMTLSLADRSQKTQKIRVLPTVGYDPEANRIDRIKKEEDKLRASLRRENKARRVRERVNQRGPTTSYLEPDVDDEDGAISISAIKNKFKQRGQNYADVYSDDDSDSASSNGSIFNKKKPTSVKKTGKISESDED